MTKLRKSDIKVVTYSSNYIKIFWIPPLCEAFFSPTKYPTMCNGNSLTLYIYLSFTYFVLKCM